MQKTEERKMACKLVAVFLICQSFTMSLACYFPQEFQGEYTMQSTMNSGSTIQYSSINITSNSIPIWGTCHKRIGNNFILMISYGENTCTRCLHLKLRSKNVLQVLASSQETISKCYINESARATCPTEKSMRSRSAAEIILFKTRDADSSYTSKEYCPIDGQFSVQYKINDEYNQNNCTARNTTIDTCPAGSTLNLRLNSCSQNYEFDCLGHWDGPDDQKYLALLDKQSLKDGKPQYRCALYKRDSTTGVVNVALSKDSTCTSELYNATSGYITMALTPKPEKTWPVEVQYSMCAFPEWMQGNWEHMHVESDTLIYKDHASFKTYTIKCAANFESEDKYLVYTRTQCDEEQYNCMRVMKRSNNILEFQLGITASKRSDIEVLCMDNNFEEGAWITQGRLDNSTKQVGMCPISGEYTGMIPQTTDLCAKLWSDCRAPELMYYQVSDCVSQEIYEEREYKCLGHWREAELLYTYTQRRDVAAGTYECFVGSIISDNEIFIKEAGEHCQRQADPLKHVMKLIKQGQGMYSCIDNEHTSGYESSSKAPSTTTSLPTKSWDYGAPAGQPNVPEETDNRVNAASCVNSCVLYILVTVCFVIQYLR